MRREYFLADSLDDAQTAVMALNQQLNLDGKHVSVVSNDTDGLRNHHLNAADLINKTDLVRGLEQGVMVGVVAGLTCFCIAAVIAPFLEWMASEPLWALLDSIRYAVLSAAFFGPICLGAALGAFIGMRHNNYKLGRFQSDLETGHHLILVDSNQLDAVKQVLAGSSVTDKGEGTTLIKPF